MLFTNFHFFLAFLPVVLVVYLILLRCSFRKSALIWLGLSSVTFYIWNDVRLFGLLLGSITVNFLIGNRLFATQSRPWLVTGILFNISLIAVFKYADFTISNINAVSSLNIGLLGIALPIGISFFTFQQIAWLVDMRSKPVKPKFWPYLLFVSFFPQLIAGPIVHHAEMMPQFNKLFGTGRNVYFSRLWMHVAIGLTIFTIGFFKKVGIADNCAIIASQMFGDAATGKDIETIAAWGGTLAYTFQIYFDFSGYSDMAIGLARMFGIRLPVNFFSPYKSGSIIEFWRRWHMTLSRWLRDYVYIPLGGNQTGWARHRLNIMATMLIGGLWHGASWTFVAWGGLHGLFLIVNHFWRQMRGDIRLGLFGWFLTFFTVTNSWVLFRAPDFTTAMTIYDSMYSWAFAAPIHFSDYWILVAAFLVVAAMPNTLEIMRRYLPVLHMPMRRGVAAMRHFFQPEKIANMAWRPTAGWLLVIAAIAAMDLYIISRSDAYVEFIYFQF